MNLVEIEVKVKDDTGRGFASVIGKAEALGKAAEDATSKLSSGGRSGLIGALQHLAFSGLSAAESLGTMPAVITPLIFLAATLATAFFPVLATFPLIAAGFVGFAAIAIPELKKVWTAVNTGGAALKKLTPEERQLVGPIRELKDEFGKLTRAIQPEILKAFGDGLRIAKALMPTFTDLVKAAGRAIDGLAQNMLHWINGPSGQKFIAWMRTDGPNAIRTFGHVVFDVIQGIGRTFDFLYNQGITIQHHWDEFLHAMGIAANVFKDAIHTSFSIAETVVGSSITSMIGKITGLKGSFGGAGSFISGVFHTIAGAAQSAASIVAGAISQINSALSSIGGIKGAVGNAARALLGGLATGGITGAANGPVTSGMRLVGEQGPELVDLPTGSRVWSNPDTMNMLGGYGNGSQNIILTVQAGSNTDFELFLATMIRRYVRVRGGNVQTVFGRN